MAVLVVCVETFAVMSCDVMGFDGMRCGVLKVLLAKASAKQSDDKRREKSLFAKMFSDEL